MWVAIVLGMLGLCVVVGGLMYLCSKEWLGEQS